MRRKQHHARFYFVIVFLLLILFGAVWSVSAQEVSSPADMVAAAWEKAQTSGAYEFRTQIDQTTTPAPKVSNAGRPLQKDRFGVEGQINQYAHTFNMTFWPNGSFAPNQGIEVKVENGRSYARQNGEWQEVGNVADFFAPGGDPLAFLASIKNVEAGTPQLLTVPELDYSLNLTPYYFDIDGPTMAAHVRRTLQRQLSEQGQLPQGIQLQDSELFRNMVGTGEIWLDADGLPARLLIDMDLGKQENGELITAQISTNLHNYDQTLLETSLLSDPQAWITAKLPTTAVQQAFLSRIGLILLTILLAFVVVTNWQSRKVYVGVALFVSISLLLSTHLQASAQSRFYNRQAEQQAALDGRQAEANVMESYQQQNQWDPHQKPSAASNKQAATDIQSTLSTLSPSALAPGAISASSTLTTTDSDGDGLSDYDEDDNYTCAYAGADYCTGVADPTDSDGDGLTDGAEVNELDTLPTDADTDGDTITDTLEVEGFFYNGVMWYLDPLNTDTNNDGILDGIECPTFSILSEELDPNGICPDTDGDGTPDVFDADNDGDGVDDNVDLSPQISSELLTDSNPFTFSIDNLETDHPVFVDVQFRPTEQDHLTYNSLVLDWPSGDYEGQIQRVLTTTFATSNNPDISSSAANASYGDIQLVPLLEITMPYTDGHYANLPVNSVYSGIDRTIGTAVGDWLDDTELEPYSISIRDVDTTSGDLVAYVPVSIVSDAEGGSLEAFTSRMIYYPEQGSGGIVNWGAAHEMRLIWAVQMITDSCIDDSEEPETCARVDSLGLIQLYDEEWIVTGLTVSEEHGLDVAVVYEDPSLDNDLQADDQLWLASWNLSNTFVRGRDCDIWNGSSCTSDGTRDVRIDNLASVMSSWITDTNILEVETYSYIHQGYLAQVVMTGTRDILNTHFAAYADETDPTLMILQEQSSRGLNVEIATDSLGSSFTFDFDPDDVQLTTLANLNWTPYEYDNGSWDSANLTDYLTVLEGWLADNSIFLSDVAGDVAEEGGKLIWAQVYYTALYNGYSGIVYVEGETVWVAATGTLDESEFEVITSSSNQGLLTTTERYKYIMSEAFSAAKKSYKTISKWSKFYRSFNANTFRLTDGLALLKVQKYSMYAVKATAALMFVGIALFFAGINSGNTTLVAVGTYVVLAASIIIVSTRTAMLVSQMVTVVRATSQISVVTRLMELSKTARSLSKLTNGLALIAIWGVFAYQVTALDLHGSALMSALAFAIAATIVLLIVIAIEFIPIIGPLFVALLSLVDLILYLFGVKGVTDRFTEWLADLLYRTYDVIKNLDDADRIDYKIMTVSLLDEETGFIESNALNFMVAVTNTLEYDSDYSDSDARKSTFRYFARTDDADMHSGLQLDDMKNEWVSLSGDYLQITDTVTLTDYVPLSAAGTGINRDLDGLFYLTEAYAVPYEGCWAPDTLGQIGGLTCKWYKIKGSNPMNIGESLIFDILPNTIGEFASLEWIGPGSEFRFTNQLDQDGDGILSISDGGTDLNDTDYDSDNDELSDAYEIAYGYDPESKDTDGDGLTDKEELQYGTDPNNVDLDGDNLSDYIEVKVGWLMTYEDKDGNSAITRVWSDPYSADADDDSLSDLVEFTFGFNPNVSTDASAIRNVVVFDDISVSETEVPLLLIQGEEESDSSVFADSSGESNHALCNSAATCPAAGSAGKYGNGIDFDAVDDYLEVNYFIDPAETNFTAAMWFKADAFDTGTYQRLMTQAPASGPGQTWLGLTDSGWYYTLMGGVYVSGGTNVSANEWHHGAVTYDGTTLTLYLDGVAVNSAPATINSSPNPLRIGIDDNSQSFYFNGLMDEIIVASEALSADGIVDLMNGRYNLNDLYVKAGDNLTYQATITNTSVINNANGLLSAASEPVDPAVGNPTIALSMDNSDYKITLANEDGSSAVFCYDDGTCPTIGAAGTRQYGLAFDGIDDRLHFPAVQRPATDEHILSFWLNVDTLPASGEVAYIMDTDSEEDGAMDIYLTDAGKMEIDVVGSDGPYVSDFTLSDSSGWQNVILLVQNSRVGFLYNYEDGNVSWRDAAALPDLLIGPGYLGSNADNDSAFDGSLDDLVFYNEYFGNDNSTVSYFYYEGIYNGNFNLGTAYNNIHDYYPIMLFRFNEVEMEAFPTVFENGVACDSVTTCPEFTDDGYSEDAAVFDGVDDYIPINDEKLYNFSATFWLKLDARPAQKGYIFDWSQTSNTYPVFYVNSAGSLVTEFYDSNDNLLGSETSSVIFDNSQLGQWTKIFVKYQHVGNDWRNYTLKVNDVVVDDYDNFRFDFDGGTETTFNVGRIGNSVDGSYPLGGDLDELSMTGYSFSFDYDFHLLDISLSNRVTDGAVALCNSAFVCPDSNAPGVFGEAISFDGIRDYITLTQVLDTGKTDFTIATWFKLNSNNGFQRILHQQDDSETGVGRVWLSIHSNGKLYTFLGGSILSGGSVVSTNTWHHAAVTYNGTTLSLYLDGTLIASADRTVEESSGDVIIGRQKDSDSYFLDGYLDEMVILPTGVTAEGINYLMNTTYPAIKTALVPSSFAVPAASSTEASDIAQVSINAIGSQHSFDIEAETALELQTNIEYPIVDDNAVALTGFFPFEEVPGSTSFEDLVDTVEATCTGINCPLAGVRGIIGRSAYFDGVDDYLTGNSYGNSISVWVKAERGTIADMTNASHREGLELDFDRFLVVTESNNNYHFQEIELDLPENVWTHVVGVVDEVNEIAYAYVNGQLVGSIALNKDSSGFSGEVIAIGGNHSGSDFLLGQVDDLRLYDDVIDANDVLTLYEASAPRFIFEFDEESDETNFTDATQNQYVGVPLTYACTDITLDTLTLNNSASDTDFVSVALDGEQIIYKPVTDFVGASSLDIDVTTTFCEDAVLSASVVNSTGTSQTLGTLAVNYGDSGAGSHTFNAGNDSLTLNYEISDTLSYQTDPVAGTDGQIGNTALFDGNGSIELTDDTIPLNLNKNSFTIMAWIKTDATGTGLLVKTDNDTAWEYGEKAFYIDDDGYPSFVGHSNGYIKGSVPITDTIWHHVAVVWDYSGSGNSGTGVMYVDGADVTNLDTYHASAADNAGDTLKIGAPNYGESQNIFEGELDEMVAYGRALTDSEIFSIYLRELRWYRDHSSARVIVDDDNPTIELLSNYPYRAKNYTQLAVSVEDGTSGIAYVEFGLKAPGESDFTWQKAAACTDSTVVWCPAFTPTSAGDHELQFRAIDAVGNETISAVYTITVDDTAPTAASTYSDTPITPTETGAYQWQFTLNGTVTDDISGVYTPTVTIDLVDSRGRVMGNRTQSAVVSGTTWTVDYRISRFKPVGTFDVRVTAEDNVGNSASTIVGSIYMDTRSTTMQSNNLLVPQYAISTTQTISGVVSDEPDWGGLAIFHFEEQVGADTFYDYSGNDETATCTACPAVTSGDSPFGQALDFDGIDDELVISDMTNLDLVDDFTIALWIKTTGSSQGIIVKSDGDSSWEPGEKAFYINDDGTARFVGWGNSYIRSDVAVNDGQWHHLVVVWDYSGSDGDGHIYVDGVEATGDDTYYVNNADNAGDTLYIGASNHNSDEANSNFDGQIDELNIFDSVLSDDEIFALAQDDVNGVGDVEIALQLIDFDVLSATTTLDEDALTWQSVGVNKSSVGASTWAYDVPAGLENYYQIHGRSTDAGGNRQTAVTLWQGMIDDLAPRATFTAELWGSSANGYTEYTFTADDLFMDIESITGPCGSESISLGYDDNSGNLAQVTGMCRLPGHNSSPTDFTVCDYFDHCTTVNTTPTVVTLDTLAILSPGNNSTITTTGTVTVSSSALAANGIEDITIQVNGTPVDGLSFGGSVTDTLWTTANWTPTVSGTYTVTAVMTDTVNNTFTDSVQVYVEIVAPYVNGDTNCDSSRNVVDALYIMQYEVGIRTGTNNCPLEENEIYLPACDVNGDAVCNVVDALYIMQCEVGIANSLCPTVQPTESQIEGEAEGETAVDAFTPGAESGATIRPSARLTTVQIGSGTVVPGDTTVLPVWVHIPNDRSLTAVTLDITYNPELVALDTCETNQPVLDLSLCSDRQGESNLRVVSITALAVSGLSGEQLLAEVGFTGLSAGITQLSLSTRAFEDGGGSSPRLRNGRLIVGHYLNSEKDASLSGKVVKTAVLPNQFQPGSSGIAPELLVPSTITIGSGVVSNGQPITMPITIDVPLSNSLRAITLRVQYDPTVLMFDSCVVNNTDFDFNLCNRSEGDGVPPDVVSFSAISAFGVNGTIELGTITFIGNNVGSSSLVILAETFDDGSGETPITVNGTVEVQEPTAVDLGQISAALPVNQGTLIMLLFTLLLAATGLVFLWRRRMSNVR